MKKTLLILILAFICVNVVDAQNKKTRAMLAEIEGQWQLDEKGELSYTQVFELEDLTKGELFSRAENYFVYNYGSGKSVIQTSDKDRGTLVGKGVFNEVHIGVSIITTYFDAWHLFRIDIKEGKARVILTPTTYDMKTVGGSNPPIYSNGLPIVGFFPVNPKNSQKTMYGKAFYKLHNRCQATLLAIGEALKNGNTVAEGEDW